MEIILLVSALCIGLCIGSFVFASIDRIEKKSLYKNHKFPNRSICTQCGAILPWYDLIPLFSFLLLQGRCRFCQKRFSSLHFFVELLFGALFALTFFFSHSFLEWCALSLFITVFLFFALYDGLYQRIPTRFFSLLALVTLLTAIVLQRSLFESLIGMVGALIFFGAQYILSGKKMIGDGDILFGMCIGFVLGIQHTIVAIAIAYSIGACVALFFLITKRKKSTIALIPFLVTGTICSLFFGDGILQIYFFSH